MDSSPFLFHPFTQRFCHLDKTTHQGPNTLLIGGPTGGLTGATGSVLIPSLLTIPWTLHFTPFSPALCLLDWLIGWANISSSSCNCPSSSPLSTCTLPFLPALVRGDSSSSHFSYLQDCAQLSPSSLPATSISPNAVDPTHLSSAPAKAQCWWWLLWRPLQPPCLLTVFLPQQPFTSF